MSIAQTVLPFKLASTDELLTAHAGLAVFGEFIGAMGLAHLVNHELPEPGSAKGYQPSAFVEPLILMLQGGGRTLEDLREIRNDTGLLTLLQMQEGLASQRCLSVIGSATTRVGPLRKFKGDITLF